MNPTGKNIILTGAAGGIGQPLAFALSRRGARLALVDRDQLHVNHLCEKINQLGGIAFPILTDFKTSEISENPSRDVVNEAMRLLGGVDVLINSAGILDFTLFEQQDPVRIEQMMHINAVVPIQLAHAILPQFFKQNSGQIVNIGSIFGSIGFPHYATYSASKFAVRGFSQALRRELIYNNITVTYIAPRAIKTSMNGEVASKMLLATKTAIDEPKVVVEEIIKAIEADKQEYYIGQPESFFAWLNGFLPSLVAMGLKKPTRIARQFITTKN
ncbi:SDR family oxidoreductase [Methylotenera versatilis]|uniref:Short-chain dehydrogenase/reductase SDR n=1 Tax=Methylotenera versatilis (strain 301) TaxID=666681 RepID=D7DJR6_METV0|nr:SDR family oxidoreductase [Methylotenera versatilis]ADI30277.1 short-chain dehydrogenase/reductase SDR [Methylotenera versatilis 301]